MEKDFGNYELRERLGKGAMGWVFAGIKKKLDMQVAIKIPFPQFSEEEEFRQRFQQEAQSMAKMNHENVVRVIDYGDHEGTPFIAMEFLEGADLRVRLDRDGSPPIEIALLMILDLCRGLEHAHSKGIVHRDLKPSNVMFTKHGVCKLMDFGLARRRDDSAQLTRTGVVMGTTPYMSPEQTRGLQVDHLSDIFSFGVICYELLGGERPFQGDSSTAIMNAILYHAPRPLDALDPLVPERVLAIVGKTLEKERADRPKSVTDVRHDVEEALIELKVPQSRELLARFSVDPMSVSQELRQARLAQCLDRGRAAAASAGGAETALAQYRSALYLDPKNKEAGSAVKKLEREVERKREPEPPPAPHAAKPPEPDMEHTQLLPPSWDPAKTPVLPVQAPVVAKPAAPKAPPPMAPPPAKKPPPPPPPKKPAAPPRPPSGVKPAAPSSARPAAGSERAKLMRLVMIAASVLVVAIVAVIVLSFQRRSGTASNEPAPEPSPQVLTSGGVRIETEPSGALVVVNGGAGVSAPIDLGAVPAGPMVLTAVLDGYQTLTDTIAVEAGWDTTLTLTLLPVSGDAPATAMATEVPVLMVRTRPAGAMVTLGSTAARQSPARFTRIRAGKIPVKIRADGYTPLDTMVTLAAGRDTSLRFTLAADPNAPVPGPAPPPAVEPSPVATAGKAWFTFRAWPWADVYVDNKQVLAHADTARVEVTPGNHAVEFRNPAYDPIQHRGRFREGATERLYAAFYLQKGHITVRTADGRPCTVFIDGRAMPMPAPNVYEVDPGKHRVRAMRDGVAATEGEKEVRLRKNERVELTFGFGSAAPTR